MCMCIAHFWDNVHVHAPDGLQLFNLNIPIHLYLWKKWIFLFKVKLIDKVKVKKNLMNLFISFARTRFIFNVVHLVIKLNIC